MLLAAGFTHALANFECYLSRVQRARHAFFLQFSANQVRSEQASAPMSSIQQDLTPYLGLAAAAAGAGIGLLGNQDGATQLLGTSSTQTIERIVLRLDVGNIYGALGLMRLSCNALCVRVHNQPTSTVLSLSAPWMQSGPPSPRTPTSYAARWCSAC